MAKRSLKIDRLFTQANVPAEDSLRWRVRPVSGFPQPVDAPESWSDTAVEIAATRYFRSPASKGGGETSVRALIARVVDTIQAAGEWQGYFDTPETGRAFNEELRYILLHQYASFNSPVYFNVGIFPKFGVLGSGENFVFDPALGRARALSSAFVHPQASACFIQDIKDDLISIFDLLKSEAKLFKYGSGTGTNFSPLRARGERLDGGGASTGLLSYLEIFDKAAGAIKSGGTTRRAAKMVVVDADHPEIFEFIDWKRMEERKARVLLANGFSGGMDGEAFRSVSGQNSNNSVRLSDTFMNAALNGGTWALRGRKDGAVLREVPARDVLKSLARAAWECGDPGVQFSDTITRWHTCPAGGDITASNPCSEYMFLDNSACNLASLNLVHFFAADGAFSRAAFAHVARLLLIAQDILVDYASYPTASIAENSHRYRPLGLGYANLGGVLMRLGLPYESEAALRFTAEITATLHGLALQASSELAEHVEPFAAWAANAAASMSVLEKHREAARALGDDKLRALYDDVLARAARFGLRNAQVTLLAPTGTIGLLMDCDTLGIEPEFALVKRKYLVGGGELKQVNQSVAPALRRLGYDPHAIELVLTHLTQTGHVFGATALRSEHVPVFDGAMPPAGAPERRISPAGHLNIMAAAQPFLSGAISKTVNLPATATVEDIEQLFISAWRLGLKSVAVYRDSSKSLQPLCAEC